MIEDERSGVAFTVHGWESEKSRRVILPEGRMSYDPGMLARRRHAPDMSRKIYTVSHDPGILAQSRYEPDDDENVVTTENDMVGLKY